MDRGLSRFTCTFVVLFICYLTLIVLEISATCKPYQLARDHLNLRLKDHGFHETTLDLHNCVRFCWYLAACKSLDYDRGTNTCKLNDVAKTDVQETDFETDGQAIYSDISGWPQV